MSSLRLLVDRNSLVELINLFYLIANRVRVIELWINS